MGEIFNINPIYLYIITIFKILNYEHNTPL